MRAFMTEDHSIDAEPGIDRGATETGDREEAWREGDVSSSMEVELWPYRDRTTALLRRYMRLAVEVGRLPSLLGREFFRARVTSYHTQTFEDSVILVHDVESCLELLDAVDRRLIGLIVLQEHSQEETAILLQCTRRTIVRRYGEALDRVSAIFLERNILARFPDHSAISAGACQEAERNKFPVSDSREKKNISDDSVSSPF